MSDLYSRITKARKNAIMDTQWFAIYDTGITDNAVCPWRMA